MENKHLCVSYDENLCTVQFNRPDKKNALTHAMYTDAAGAVREAEQTADIRVILIRGTKTCFTAGNDLVDFLNRPPAEGTKPVMDFLISLAEAEKPVIAAVNGFAVGIGTTMLFHCDLVYAGENAKFQMPFVNLGLCPEAGSSLILPRMIGHQAASELLFFSHVFDAPKAREIGLINGIFPEETFLDKTVEQAEALCKKPPRSVRLTKKLLKAHTKKAVLKQIEMESAYFEKQLESAEAKEAMTAVLEKREPRF